MSVLLALLLSPYYLFLEIVYFIFRCRPRKEIKNQQILITGAGQGIGAQFARQLSAMGNTIHCVDIDKKLVQGVVDEIRKNGGQAHAYTCDLTKHEQVQELHDTVTSSGFFISMLINNAGVAFLTKVTEMSLTQIQHSLTVNLIANMWLIKLFLPKMVEMGKGHIVNMASLSGYFAIPCATTYSAAKAASIQTMKQLRSTDFIDSNVNFTAIVPYFVNTKLMEGSTIPDMLSTEEVVEKSIIGIRENQEEVILPAKYKSALILRNFIPSFIRLAFLRTQMKDALEQAKRMTGQKMAEKIK